jgi:hypothetical protein
MTGRPSSFTQEIADVICERILAGESVRSICSDETMPSLSMVFRWLKASESFREQYAHTREVQAHVIADDTRDIVDNEPDPARARVMLDQRKWHASKLLPKVYGDRQEIRHADPDGNKVAFVLMGVPEAASSEEWLKQSE